MLKVRPAVGASVSTEAFRGTVAEAAAGDILSAICAMKVPRPTRMAAKIIRLRMTPHTRFRVADITTTAAKPRLTEPGQAAILAKRMSEVLTAVPDCAPAGVALRVGGAPAGASPPGGRGQRPHRTGGQAAALPAPRTGSN